MGSLASAEGVAIEASWFETCGVAALLTMRDYQTSS